MTIQKRKPFWHRTIWNPWWNLYFRDIMMNLRAKDNNKYATQSNLVYESRHTLFLVMSPLASLNSKILIKGLRSPSLNFLHCPHWHSHWLSHIQPCFCKCCIKYIYVLQKQVSMLKIGWIFLLCYLLWDQRWISLHLSVRNEFQSWKSKEQEKSINYKTWFKELNSKDTLYTEDITVSIWTPS